MIEIKDVEGTTLHMVSKAFAKPGHDAELHFDRWTPMPEYLPYLIEIVGMQDDRLTFRGLSLADPTKTSAEYEVDLDNVEHAWRRPPSTLNDWNKDTSSCALLFLHASYTGDKPDLEPGNCGKYPCRGGDFRSLAKEHVELQARVRKLVHVLSGGDKAKADQMFKGIL